MSSEIKVDTISENTSANGVAIDSVTLKDGGVTGTAAIVAGGGNGPTLGFQLKDTSGNAQPRLTNDANNDTVIRPGASGRAIMLANYANNATAINVDDSGHVTKPLQPAFVATNSVAQSNLSTNTAHTIQLNSETYDVNSDFNTSTYKFTSPVTGKYQLNFVCRLDAIPSDYNFLQISIVTSNRSYIMTLDGGRRDGGDLIRYTGSVLADMDSSDTAHLTVYQNTGTAATDIVASCTTFSGFLAC